MNRTEILAYWKKIKSFSIADMSIRDWGIALAIGAFVILVVGFVNQHAWYTMPDGEVVKRFKPVPLIEDFYANISAELASVSVTILLVDRLYRRQDDREIRERLFHRMKGGDKASVREATAEMLAHKGWLKLELKRSRSTHGLDFESASFYEEDLSEVWHFGSTFRNANLRSVNFRDAKITYCDFENAVLSFANFQNVRIRRSTFVAADLSYANFDGIKPAPLYPSIYADDDEAEKITNELLKAKYLKRATMPEGTSYSGWVRRDNRHIWRLEAVIQGISKVMKTSERRLKIALCSKYRVLSYRNIRPDSTEDAVKFLYEYFYEFKPR
ncbi:MAG: pentapeptide repeat-containing protein [Chloroflexota bacterium]